MVLVLARAALRRMAALFLRASLPRSNPPQVCSSGQIRRNFGVDSCQLLGAARLGFLVCAYATAIFGVKFFKSV